MTGHHDDQYQIVPFRGDYYTFRPQAGQAVTGLVYPVPDPAFPFAAVHLTRGIDGSLHAGPEKRAVPSFAREKWPAGGEGRDLLDTVRFPGLRGLARTYAGTGAQESLARPGQARLPGRDAPVHPGHPVP